MKFPRDERRQLSTFPLWLIGNRKENEIIHRHDEIQSFSHSHRGQEGRNTIERINIPSLKVSYRTINLKQSDRGPVKYHRSQPFLVIFLLRVNSDSKQVDLITLSQ